MSKTLSISLIICALVVGMGAGYYFTPQYLTVQDSMRDLGPADRSFDLRYTREMAAHHKGAMMLAEQVRGKSQRQEINSLAEAILTDEPKLIAELDQWRKDWYKDGSKVRDPKVAQLGSYDDKLDLRFLNALIAHHEAGIAMAKETQIKSSRNEVLNNAMAVEKFLSDGLVMLNEWRSEWYKIN